MNPLVFEDQHSFEAWLMNNHETAPGQWIRFDKQLNTSRLTPDQALIVALCFGWIDGQIKKIDDQFYVKYFAKRTKSSIWSTRNKQIAESLIEKGLMTSSGMKAIKLAKEDGRWERSDLPPADYDIEDFRRLLKRSEIAYDNYMSFSPSIQRTYAMSYFVLKKEESRAKRLNVIIDRLEKNLKPM